MSDKQMTDDQKLTVTLAPMMQGAEIYDGEVLMNEGGHGWRVTSIQIEDTRALNDEVVGLALEAYRSQTRDSGNLALREILKQISSIAIEMAITRYSLQSDEGEPLDIQHIKSDVLDCLTGDELGCLDPEDVGPDTVQLEWLRVKLARTTTAPVADAHCLTCHHKDVVECGQYCVCPNCCFQFDIDADCRAVDVPLPT